MKSSCRCAKVRATVFFNRGKSGASRKQLRSGGARVADVGARVNMVAKRVALLGMAALVLTGLLMGVNSLRNIEISDVFIYGYTGSEQSNRGVRLEELELLLRPYRSQPYWQIDLRALQLELESHTWVRRATLYRAWPSTIRIGIDEQLPIARWNSSHLLASSGDLIVVENAALFSSLPNFVTRVHGRMEPVTIRQMVAHYNSFQKILNGSQQKIIELGMSSSQNAWLMLGSGARIELGKERQLSRLKRLVSLVDGGVIAGWRGISVADLRYEKGVSINWIDATWEEEMESLTPLASIVISDWSLSYG